MTIIPIAQPRKDPGSHPSVIKAATFVRENFNIKYLLRDGFGDGMKYCHV